MTLDEIGRNEWKLLILRYVEPISEEKAISVEQAITNLSTEFYEANAAEDRLTALLHQNGLVLL